VNHLNPPVIDFDTATGDNVGILGQVLFDPFAAGIKENKVYGAGLVTAQNAKGLCRAGRDLMGMNPEAKRCDLAGDGLLDFGRKAAVDPFYWPVPEEIQDLRPADKLFKQAPVARPDSGQQGQRLEQRVKNERAHLSFLGENSAQAKRGVYLVFYSALRRAVWQDSVMFSLKKFSIGVSLAYDRRRD